MPTLVVPSPKSAGIDAHISRVAAQQAFNYGVATTMRLQSNSATAFLRTLLACDLSAVPVGSTINSAILTVVNNTNTMSGSQACTGYPLSRALVEGSGNGSATLDGATWLTYDGTNLWTTAGGDYDAAHGSAFTISNADTVGSSYNWNLTAAVAAGFAANVGGNGIIPLLLRLDTEGGSTGTYAIYSSDDATDANRPYFTVTYTPPTPPQQAGGTAAILSLLGWPIGLPWGD